MINKSLITLVLAATSTTVSADLINFTFTGRLTVLSTDGKNLTGDLSEINNFGIVNGNDDTFGPYGYQTPIAANLTIDTATGTGFSDLSFQGSFMGSEVTYHGISLTFLENNMISGTFLGDWNGTFNNPVSILWDGTGLFNAIDYGLQVGDRISGDQLFRDTDADGYGDTFETNIGSATPWSDYHIGYSLGQGPAPIATAPGVFGITDGPFAGIQVHIDIGSGNSLHVASIAASPVPVPAAAWLFGSGLLGLIGVARRKKAA